MSFLRSPALANLLGLANLAALGAATLHLRSHHVRGLEAHEARMDELEGTLRGHVGLIEDALERIEGRRIDGQSERAQALYTSRARDGEKKKKESKENQKESKENQKEADK